jgi:RHS repeat-associated protein
VTAIRTQAEWHRPALLAVAAAFLALAVPRAATAQSCSNPFQWYDVNGIVHDGYGNYINPPESCTYYDNSTYPATPYSGEEYALYWAHCDGSVNFIQYSACQTTYQWSVQEANSPGLFNLGVGCNNANPVTTCNETNCIGEYTGACDCPYGGYEYQPGTTIVTNCGTCSDGYQTCDASGTGYWSGCFNECLRGCTNPTSPNGTTLFNVCGPCGDGNITCTNDVWGECSGWTDSCMVTTPPPTTEPQNTSNSTGTQAQVTQMNAGCVNGDWGGYDPLNLPLKSASTLPFTDFEVTVLRALGVTRSYSSSDVMSGTPAGFFGLGWHHNWEAKLTCGSSGASCTVDTGTQGVMKFTQSGTAPGVGALAPDTLVLYVRAETAVNLTAGGRNLLVRRQSNGEFILFQLDGSELHFAQPSVCGTSQQGATACMDASFNGTRQLSRDVDPVGRGAQLDFTVSGKLLTVTDDLGNMLSLLPAGTSGACASRAGALNYRAGQVADGSPDTNYVTYVYDPTCQVLKTVIPSSSSYSPAPNHSPQLRAYAYQSSPKAGLLTTVYNEFNDPITVFGYDSTSGAATSLVDAGSSLTVTYPAANQDKVVSAYGSENYSVLSTRGAAGKATAITTTANLLGPYDSTIMSSGSASTWGHGQSWDGLYLTCTESQDFKSYIRYFKRDTGERVTLLADYPFPSAGNGCAGAPWNTSQTPLRSWTFQYGLSKPIYQNGSLPLSTTTYTAQQSVFAAQLAAAAGSGTSPSAFQTSETLDYDPTFKSTIDPSWYSCGTANLPIGAAVCRKIVDGYTYGASGTPTLQRLITYFSYDGRGRLVRTVGPVILIGQLTLAPGTPPLANVDPVEERTYWSDTDPDPLKRGRLYQIKKWASGWSPGTSAPALTTTFQAYDVFGPTQVLSPSDPVGGPGTIYTRAGGAGRVTRVDTPDGRHTSTRYYDGDLPRLRLLNGGSTRQFTYDSRGRLKTTAPLSVDPEPGSTTVTQGWIETRSYDLAGNVTQITRADALGTVRWQQGFDYYWNGTARKNIHPVAGNGYALTQRTYDGVPTLVYDEENDAVSYSLDALRRVQYAWFVAPLDVPANHGNPGYAHGQPGFYYTYEAGQDALSGIWNNSAAGSTGTNGLIAGYVHDDFGRLLSVSAPTTMTAGPYAYVYDARGNILQRSGGGSTISYRYDGVNRITKLVATRTADASSFEYDYQYDDPSAVGRLHSISEPARTTTFTYDEVGRTRFEVVAETGVTLQLTSEYRYDADGDLSEVITPAGLDVKYVRDPTTKDVTKVWNVVSGTAYASNVTHYPVGPINGLTFAGGKTLTQNFNLRYQPVSIVDPSGLGTLSYVMSPAGNPKTVGTTSYTYDLRSRVVTEAPFEDTRYAFAFADGSTQSSRMIAASTVPWSTGPNQLKYAFGYDNGSNLSAISTYDSTGATITGTTCLVHDALGRLTAVGPAKVVTGQDARACQSENDLASVTVRFQYDARNRRVARQDGTGAWKYWVMSPDGNPLAEMWKPTSSGGAWSVAREYVWLEGRPLAQVEYPGPSGGNEGYVYLVHVDHLGQPRALTSTAGAVVWSSTPRAYGDIVGDLNTGNGVEKTTADPANGLIVRTNLRLPGQYDERLLGNIGLSGPYYNGARWYLPAMARYMELDPVALHGGVNGTFAPDWYGYANQNPLRWTDPNGQFIGAAAGFVFGGLYGGLGSVMTGGSFWNGAAAGALTGVVVGALIDPSTSIGAAAYIGMMGLGGVLSASAGAAFGQYMESGHVNGGGVLGAGIAGGAAGLFAGVIGYYIPASAAMPGVLGDVGGEWFKQGIANLVAGPAAWGGEWAGNALADRNMKPWQDSGTRSDWLRAAGCKP